MASVEGSRIARDNSTFWRVGRVSVPQGAATHVWCAVSSQLDGKGGVFCADSDITPVLPKSGFVDLAGDDRLNRLTSVEAYAIDPEAAEELWRRSEEIANISI